MPEMDLSMYDWHRDSTYEDLFLNYFAIHRDSDMTSCQSTDEVRQGIRLYVSVFSVTLVFSDYYDGYWFQDFVPWFKWLN